MFKKGDKVKYIGNAIPECTGKILKVKSIVQSGLILYLPKEKRSEVFLEGSGFWGINSLICSETDVEEFKPKGLKAYYVYDRENEEKGGEVVFAENARKAKPLIYSTIIEPDCYINVRVLRAPDFDGYENSNEEEIMLKKWLLGWWFDDSSVPDVETSTEDDFRTWYSNNQQGD